MEMMEILSSRWLEVAVAVYLIGMMLYGHYRGFIKIAVSAMSLFITLFAARVAIPQAAAWLEHNTAVYETMKESSDSRSRGKSRGTRGHRESGDPGPDQKASDRE